MRGATLGHEGAHDVIGHAGRSGSSTHLSDREKSALIPGGQPENEITAGEIGKQRPFRHDELKPIDVSLSEVGALFRQSIEDRHVSRLPSTG